MTTTARRTWSDLDVVEWVRDRLNDAGVAVVEHRVRWISASHGAVYGPGDGPSISRLKRAGAAGLLTGESVVRKQWQPGVGYGNVSTPSTEVWLRLTDAGRRLLEGGTQ